MLKHAILFLLCFLPVSAMAELSEGVRAVMQRAIDNPALVNDLTYIEGALPIVIAEFKENQSEELFRKYAAALGRSSSRQVVDEIFDHTGGFDAEVSDSAYTLIRYAMDEGGKNRLFYESFVAQIRNKETGPGESSNAHMAMSDGMIRLEGSLREEAYNFVMQYLDIDHVRRPDLDGVDIEIIQGALQAIFEISNPPTDEVLTTLTDIMALAPEYFQIGAADTVTWYLKENPRYYDRVLTLLGSEFSSNRLKTMLLTPSILTSFWEDLVVFKSKLRREEYLLLIERVKPILLELANTDDEHLLKAVGTNMFILVVLHGVRDPGVIDMLEQFLLSRFESIRERTKFLYTAALSVDPSLASVLKAPSGIALFTRPSLMARCLHFVGKMFRDKKDFARQWRRARNPRGLLFD